MPRDSLGHFYYEWFPTIFKADTQHLSLAEDGAYRRLLDEYMLTRTPLPCDDRALARIAGVGWQEWGDVKDAVMRFFKPSTNPAGFYHHSFCDDTIAKHNARITTARANGGKGGRPKKPNNKGNNPAGFESETQRKAEQNITEENNKKENSSDEEQKKNTRGMRLLDYLKDSEAIPADMRAYAVTLGWSEPKIADVWGRFLDFWRGVAGKDGVKLDWPATWRNKCRSEMTDRKPKSEGKHGNFEQQNYRDGKHNSGFKTI